MSSFDGISNLAARAELNTGSTPEFGQGEWLPTSASLAVPRQAVAGRAARSRPSTSPIHIASRRALVLICSVVLAGLAFTTPARIYAEDGFSGLELLALTLFGALTLPISCWFVSAVIGFVLNLRRQGGDDLGFSATPRKPTSRTALLMPLYNEDPVAAFARLSKIERSLSTLGAQGSFDIFVLSDTTGDRVADEEWACFQVFRLTSHCRPYYRRRTDNAERKAGNISDWVRKFGAAYEHMLILDADSTMSGETICHLVEAMERRPDLGLIQTTPIIVEAKSLYARTQQFGVRLYGRVAGAGLAWWSGSESSYWGHNAIVRVRAFAQCCGLPVLKGRKPFGGHVMSHDVVEAAMLRRGGWGVHLTAALDGSFEETPPSLQDFMSRDRRWCQGNMQHLQLLSAPGLHAMSRLQMVIGILAYWASPLWFMSLLTGLVIQFQTAPKLEEIATLHGWRTIVLPRHDGMALVWMTALTWLLLFGPKLLGSLLVMIRQEERQAFGGSTAVAKGVALEMIMSMVMAPMMMVSHTRMLIQIFMGKDSGWTTQQREAARWSWSQACAFHAWELRAGMVFAAALLARPDLFFVFSPIVLPLILAPAISILTSKTSLGDRARALGFLLTPEELKASPQRASLRSHPESSAEMVRRSAPVAAPELAEAA